MHLIHDLRIVLLALAGSVETLRRSAHGDSLMREFDGFDRLLESGIAMADELLVSTELKPPVAPIDVHEAIARNCDVIQGILGPNVRVETLLAKEESRVYARQVDLDRILLNVVCNAAAAMPSGGVLMIETAHLPRRPDDAACYPDAPFGRLRLTVADTGKGVSMREVWQVRDSTQLPRPDGRGIGLSSVSLIVLRLGGTLQIVGREDSGTVVEITLPLTHPACERVH
jgi:two-component system cell cycle sensor histidine kinase/response regulator CckA